MKMPIFLLSTALLGCVSSTAQPLQVASWNLGWHISLAEHAAWAARCELPYLRDNADGIWKPVPAGTSGATTGWKISESRAKVQGVDLAVMPPCGVYQAPDRTVVAVTADLLADRNTRISALLGSSVNADVIAFQEVSGVAAVQEALGSRAGSYHVCAHDGAYKVQRLAFAWRKTLGGDPLNACRVEGTLALSHLPLAEQVRPGYVLNLKIQDKRWAFFNVHLKAGCVAPLGNRGRLDQNTGPTDPCPVLQQQVAPLEAALEQLAGQVDHFVVLGDFNRNLWLEANGVEGAQAVRSDGSTNLTLPLAPGVKTQNLLAEINDGTPLASRVSLVPLRCELDPALAALCERSRKEVVSRNDLGPLGAATALGCRNAVGLDHFLVSSSLADTVKDARKVPIGPAGKTLAASAFAPAQLAASDHCPIVMQVGR